MVYKNIIKSHQFENCKSEDHKLTSINCTRHDNCFHATAARQTIPPKITMTPPHHWYDYARIYLLPKFICPGYNCTRQNQHSRIYLPRNSYNRKAIPPGKFEITIPLTIFTFRPTLSGQLPLERHCLEEIYEISCLQTCQ